ncbi:hypothetical protein [Bacillus sp. UNC322MFChir4.1]|uniref:hypothetical protein n=1 Tax=Bacillus sp. UNC322MFChir4.1 TaxID=1449045 RepID=UPI0006924C87|nr:hypothetical protein [Bacillus sp. UNC322MFChir4.1]
MKQLKATILSVVAFSSLLLVGGCQTADKQTGDKTGATETTKDVREIAWNSLSDSQKKEVIGGWKDTQVSKTVADTNGFALKDRSFEGKEVTQVVFRSTKSSLLGDIIKLVDEESGKVVGAGLRE